MAWQLAPSENVQQELDKIPELTFRGLMAEVKDWVENGDFDNLAIARGIIDRGYSEDFAWWLLKEVEIREASGTA